MSNLDKLARKLGSHVYDISSKTDNNRPKRKRTQVLPRVVEWNVKTVDYYTRDFESYEESREWDKFYNNPKLSDAPFYGLSTHDSAVALLKILSQSKIQLSASDLIVEVGHGKHPMIDEVRGVFKVKNMFLGIEFSAMAIAEAIRNHTICNLDCSQFLVPTCIDYYNSDGVFEGDIVYSTIGNKCILKKGCAKLLIGRCVLDYITSRLFTSATIVDWDDDPRIPNGVIRMFNSFTCTLIETYDSGQSAAIVFIEPFDKVKFRDHILTLFKVLCIASLVINCESKHLKLERITTNLSNGIICYMLIKVKSPASTFEEIYNGFIGVCKKVLKFNENQDPDWLLPMKMPKNWLSDDKDSFDILTSFKTASNGF